MRTAARALVFVLPILAALACGGRVDGVGGDGGGSSSGGSGSGSGGSSGGSSGGGPSCPPPAQVKQGAVCHSDTYGTTCASNEPIYDCNGNRTGTVDCTCDTLGDGTSGVWQCLTSSPGCPPTSCPPPQTITANGSCTTSPGLSCPSNLPVYGCDGSVVATESCSCDGGNWFCSSPGTPGCPDVQFGCPAPAGVEQGVSCTAPPGEQCPGNPQLCDGMTFYDAFQCENGSWNDVATTSCFGEAGIEGGWIDAGLGD